MEIEKLKYVAVIAEFKSISKAAEKLHMTQPALTRYLNHLEEQVGTKLFDRSTLPIRLTCAGEWYISRMAQILEMYDSMSQEIQEIVNGTRGKIIVGMSPGRLDHWAPHLLPAFQEQYPEAEVELVTGGHRVLEQALLKREIDLAFLPLPVHSFKLDYTIVAEEMMVFALAQGHPALEGKQLPPDSLISPVPLEAERLNGQTFLTVPSDHGIFKIWEEVLRRNQIRPGKILEFPDSNLTYKLACENMGIAFIQDSTVLYPGYYKRACCATIDDPPVKSPIAAVYRIGEELSPLARRFLQVTVEIVGRSPYLEVHRSEKKA